MYFISLIFFLSFFLSSFLFVDPQLISQNVAVWELTQPYIPRSNKRGRSTTENVEMSVLLILQLVGIGIYLSILNSYITKT